MCNRQAKVIRGLAGRRMVYSLGLVAFLAMCFLHIAVVRAESIQDQVTNYSGPTWASVTHSTDITALDFAATGTPTSSFSPTDILGPASFDPAQTGSDGSFTMNIDLAGSTITSVPDPDTGGTDYTYTLTNLQNDFLTLDVNVANTPQTVFDTTGHAIQTVSYGYEDFGGGFELYWFAFQEAKPSAFAKFGDTIGGTMFVTPGQNGPNYGDIKLFDVSSVPATDSAEGGFTLMALMGAVVGWRKFARRRLAYCHP